MSLPIYEGTKLIVDKDIKLKWQDINDSFLGTFEEDLEDWRVYVNIRKSSLYWIACMYPMFPCTNMIHWKVSYMDLETMVLSSFSRIDISTFRAQDY